MTAKFEAFRSGVDAFMKRVLPDRPAPEPDAGPEARTMDQRIGAPDRDAQLARPKRAREVLRPAITDAALNAGGFAAAFSPLAPKYPALVIGVAAAAGPAIRATVNLYKSWRKTQNADRPEG